METNTNEQDHAELLTTAHKNRSKEIRRVIESWQASGKSQKVFCEENKFKYSTFGSWIAKFKKGKMKKNKTAAPANGFSEVVGLNWTVFL